MKTSLLYSAAGGLQGIPNGRRVLERCEAAWLWASESAQKPSRERGRAASRERR